MGKSVLKYSCRIFVFILLLTTNDRVSAFQSEIDSLKAILHNIKSDSAKANIWNQLSRRYFDEEEYDTSLVYGQKALSLAKKAHYQFGTAKASCNIANVFLMQSRYEEAIQYNLNALKIYQEIHKEKEQSKIYSNLGIVYFQLSLYPKSLDAFLKALKINIAQKDSIEISQDYRDIGMVSAALNRLKEAVSYYQKAINIQEKTNDIENLAITYNNLALIYNNQAKYEKAIEFHQKAIHIFESLDNSYGLGYFYNSLGIVYKNLGNYQKAMDDYQKALQLKKKFKDRKGISEVENNIGKIYYLQNNIPEAKKHLNVSLQIAQDLKLKNLLVAIYQNLSITDSLNGDYKSALTNYQKATIYRDSIFNDESKNEIEQLKMNYEFSIKEDSIKMSNLKEMAVVEAKMTAQKRENWLLSIGLILLSIIGIMLYYQSKTHQKNSLKLTQLNNELDKEIDRNKLLNKEMHHRIKNNLFMVYSLLNIQEHSSNNEETQKHLSAARQRIESIASLHEQLYHKNPGKIHLNDYLSNFISHFEQQFTNERYLEIITRIDENIRIEVFLGMPIAMLLNEWMINSVKHAKTNHTPLVIHFNAKLVDEHQLSLEYFDNGVSTDEPAQQDIYSPVLGSVGMRIITLLSRQIKGELLNNYKGEAFHYHIQLNI
ncbi:MAG: tetratricopeptide repeat protein [Chitinophagales bacterium]|nr:tetratricopeptide repeat protein [Chitinophagales bacterium]